MKASELKKGMVVKEGNDFYVVVEMEHRTPGNLRAIYQATLKNLLAPKIINRRYSPSDTVEKVDLESKNVQYLFVDHVGFHFMDMESYETHILPADLVGDAKDYMKENLAVELLYNGHNPIAVELPLSIDLKVIESAPGIRGDTSGKTTKPAKLETGINVNVPLFIEEGDVIKVDTRNGQYLSRV